MSTIWWVKKARRAWDTDQRPHPLPPLPQQKRLRERGRCRNTTPLSWRAPLLLAARRGAGGEAVWLGSELRISELCRVCARRAALPPTLAPAAKAAAGEGP